MSMSRRLRAEGEQEEMSKRLKEEEEQEERWSKGLPHDILQFIAQRLYISDYQVFRQVCPNWRAAVITGIATKTCFPAPQLPWLLLRKAYDSLHAFSIDYRFSCVRDPRIFPSIKIADHPPDPAKQDDEPPVNVFNSPGAFPTASLACLGSIGSWLIVAAHARDENDQYSTTVINFFLNPLSHVRLMLPPQSNLEASVNGYPKSSFRFKKIAALSLEAAVGGYPKSTFLFKKIVASSPPGLPEQDCVVVALTKPGKLASCRPNDAAWTLIDPDYPIYRDIEILDGKLYAVTEGPMILMVFDMAPEVANVTRARKLRGYCLVRAPDLDDSVWRYPCLAKDSASKELLLVLRRRNINEGFKVYKTNDMIPNGMRWEPVTDLGGRTMFLSDQSSRVIYDKTLGKNCIYFAFMSQWNGEFGVYDLKDSSVKLLHFPEDYSATTSDGGNCRSLWFTPYIHVFFK